MAHTLLNKIPHTMTIAGKHIARRDVLLISTAVGLVLFGGILGALGLLSVKPTPTPPAAQEVVDQADLLNHQFSYLPGSQKQEGGGLKIIPRGFVIVNQDGSGGQSNPPINTYGTYLEDVKDISIQAVMAPGKAIASLRLYTELPLIADEFRIEHKSLDFTINGNALAVSTWDGDQPATTTYTFSGSGDVTLTMTRQNRILTINVNGQQVGTLPEGNLFTSGKIWFGADAGTDAWLLKSLHANALNGQVTITDGSKASGKPATDSFQALATKKRPGFTIGAAMALGPLVADAEYRGVALGQFGSLTTENALKWQFVHPQPNDYDFAEGDAMVDLAARNGLNVHAHTLVFGEANPPWVQALPVATDADKKQVQSVMLDHIATVAGHYKGKVASWDVVNEPLADYPAFEKGQIYRNHKWFQAMGKDYIAKAFQAARAADPDAKLFMNEFGLEEDGPRWEAFLALVTELKRQNVPIDGVGFQAHIYESTDRINTAVLRKHIQQLAALDLVSRISEIDVYNDDGTAIQSEQYTNVLAACMQEQACKSFTTWGVTDRYDYFKDAGVLTQGHDFLYDSDVKPTPAADALRELLSR